MNLTGAQLDSCISSDSSCAEIPVKFLGHPSYEVSCLFLCLKSENKLTSKKKMRLVYVGSCWYSSFGSNLANSEATTFNQKVFQIIHRHLWRILHKNCVVLLEKNVTIFQCPLFSG